MANTHHATPNDCVMPTSPSTVYGLPLISKHFHVGFVGFNHHESFIGIDGFFDALLYLVEIPVAVIPASFPVAVTFRIKDIALDLCGGKRIMLPVLPVLLEVVHPHGSTSLSVQHIKDDFSPFISVFL